MAGRTLATKPNYIRCIIIFTFISFFLLLPTILDVIFGFYQELYLLSLSRLVVSLLMFLMPLVFFYKNVKLYFYFLSVFVILNPLFIATALWFNARPNFSLVSFLLQTNVAEVREVTRGILKPFLLISFLYLLLYLFTVYKFPLIKVSFKKAAAISLAAIVVNVIYIAVRKYNNQVLTSDILEENYPVSLLSGLGQAYAFKQKNNLDQAENFHFNAFRNDSVAKRQVHVLVIGESSRFDRWGINGYPKSTSPRLKARPNLISFSQAISGSNLTWMAVPQIITRAVPTNLDLQLKEKSILAAFKDAGFKTVWLSNQSDKDIFWSGTITLHAKTADVAVFSPNTSPNFDSWTKEYHDERLLPLLDSIIKADNQDIFFVLHTMGNHWEYTKRYPKSFDYFTPSGNTIGYLDTQSSATKAAISNSYDNSIRYADYVLDSVISTLNQHQLVSTVTFLSDHGEDLFDLSPNKIDFHVTPAPATLHIPFFIWTSENYKSLYPEKTSFLSAHQAKKIGTENAFYTVLDLANISFPGFDLRKSISSAIFQESAQMYYHNLDKKAYHYADLTRQASYKD